MSAFGCNCVYTFIFMKNSRFVFGLGWSVVASGFTWASCDGRYKSLCEATWPNYRGVGSPRDAVELICRQLDYQHDDYRLGRWLYSVLSHSSCLSVTVVSLRMKLEESSIIIFQTIWLFPVFVQPALHLSWSNSVFGQHCYQCPLCAYVCGWCWCFIVMML